MRRVSRTPPTASPHVARRRSAAGPRIRDASVRLFAQRGFAGTGIREIAAEAGVTSAAMYHWFGTKEQLLVEIMDDVLERLTASAEDLIAADERPEAQLAALTEHHVWFHAVNQLATIVTDTELRALGGDARSGVIARRDRYQAVWRSVIDRGVTDGVFRVDDARITTTALLQMCTGVVHWYQPTGPLTLTRLCRIHADLALAMVRASRHGVELRAGDLGLSSPAAAPRSRQPSG